MAFLHIRRLTVLVCDSLTFLQKNNFIASPASPIYYYFVKCTSTYWDLDGGALLFSDSLTLFLEYSVASFLVDRRTLLIRHCLTLLLVHSRTLLLIGSLTVLENVIKHGKSFHCCGCINVVVNAKLSYLQMACSIDFMHF